MSMFNEDEPPDDRPTIPLRHPCKCGGTVGRLKTVGSQDTVRCTVCNTFQYNAPKVETGRKARTVSTVHAAISASMRARVLLNANGKCEMCGHVPAGPEESLHVGHMLSVKDGLAEGLTELEMNSQPNLAAMCQQCNLGLSSESVPLRFLFRVLMARVRRKMTTIDKGAA